MASRTSHDPRPSRTDPPRWLPAALFGLVALLLVVPALPGLPWTLSAEDVLLFGPPFWGFRPADLLSASNGLLLDPVEVFHPDLEWIRTAVWKGRLPLWNPFAGGGWPILHSQQVAPLYPLNWPALALPLWDSTGVVAALHVLVAAVGTYLFTRRSLGLLALPATLAAIAYACSSYFVAWLEHPHDNVYALLPFALLAVGRVIARATLQDAALLAAVVGLALLGGHPQSVFIISLPVLAFGAWRLRAAERPARAAALVVAGAVLGLLAGAVMVIPFAEILGQSDSVSRGGLGGLERRTLLSLFLPDRWGRPDWAYQDPTMGGIQNYFERTLYVGAPALMLAAGGLVARRSGEQILFALCALGGAALAVQLPGITWFANHVPPFANVTMIRALIIATFALAVLAGYGLQRWIEGDRGERRRVLLGAAAVAVLPALWLLPNSGVLDALPQVPGVVDDRDDAILDANLAGAAAAVRWFGVALIVLVVLQLGRTRPRRAGLAAAMVLAIQAGDLLVQSRGVHPVVPTRDVAIGAPGILSEARARAGDGRVIAEGAFLAPNLATRYGLRDARVREQPHLRRYWDLWYGYIEGTGSPLRFVAAESGSGRLMDAFGVTAFMTPPGGPAPPLPQLRATYTEGDGAVYANRTALPRAYLATDWRTAEDEADSLAATLASSTEDLRRAPVVEDDAEPAPNAGPPGRARIRLDGANRIEVYARSPLPGRLVLLDTYFPGWHATVNGRPADILAANTAFRAVAVPAGASKVVFSYLPASLAVGTVVSTLGWLAIAAALLAPVLSRRRRRPVSDRPRTATAPPPR